MADVSAKGMASAAPTPRAGRCPDRWHCRNAGRPAGVAASPPGPLPHQAVLLADAGLVLKPDLDGLALGQMADMSLQGRGEVFLNAVTFSLWPGARSR